VSRFSRLQRLPLGASICVGGGVGAIPEYFLLYNRVCSTLCLNLHGGGVGAMPRIFSLYNRAWLEMNNIVGIFFTRSVYLQTTAC